MVNRNAIIALALGLTAAVTACDSGARIDQITAPPAFSQGATKKVARLVRTNTTFSGCVSADMNPSGGTMQYTSGTETVVTLTVPKKAVNANTQFTICPTTDGTLGFHFTATEKNGNKVHEFNTPLKLSISYSSATNITATDRLDIVYVVNGAAVEKLGGSMDVRNRTVTGNVFHFSSYVIGTD